MRARRIGAATPAVLGWKYSLHHRPEDSTALRLVVELVYDAGCPNVDKARAVLSRALQEAGAPAVWTEWCADDPSLPETHVGLGSPAILVNGKDVAPGPHPWAPRLTGQGPRCRIYRDGSHLSGAPPVSLVLAAIMRVLEPDVV
ncbi:MAG: hypothetical protein Q8N53_13815 [Longimicrobiales bacterium]|nr:hypothetical protein [Longimicrobiales bacterium]